MKEIELHKQILCTIIARCRFLKGPGAHAGSSIQFSRWFFPQVEHAMSNPGIYLSGTHDANSVLQIEQDKT